jgi:7-carboxy-7-deazaguanine synthase
MAETDPADERLGACVLHQTVKIDLRGLGPRPFAQEDVAPLHETQTKSLHRGRPARAPRIERGPRREERASHVFGLISEVRDEVAHCLRSIRTSTWLASGTLYCGPSHEPDGHRIVRITEIYSSIQGETQYAGLPCTLVRTTGCDLRCGYCDSAFAFHGGQELTVEQILAEVARLGAPLVLLTGGEPMLQRELPALAARLLEAGYRVMIETSGGQPLDSLPAEVVRVVDVKTPGSGESHRNRWELLATLRPRDAVKFVLTDEADYRWAVEMIRGRELASRTEVLLSPVHGRLDPKELVAWMLRDRVPARLNLQLHKYIWDPDARRV